MKTKAVLFDLDGTLLDTHKDIATSANKILQEYGLKIHPEEDYKRFIGGGTEKILRLALEGEHFDEAVFDNIMHAYVQDYAMHCTEKTSIYSGMTEALHILADDGWILGVVSNKADDLVWKCVRHYFKDIQFSIVLGLSDKWKKKPSPEGLFLAMKTINLPVEDIIYVGDSLGDYQSAHAAGIPFIGINWGYENLTQYMPTLHMTVIENDLELINAIRKSNL